MNPRIQQQSAYCEETRDTRNHRGIRRRRGEREHTSRDDNSSEGHPEIPAALRDGSLSDTPLKAHDLRAHAPASAPFSGATTTSRRRRPRFRTHRRRFYTGVLFHVRSLAHPVHPSYPPPRRPFCCVLQQLGAVLSQVWREVSHCTNSARAPKEIANPFSR